MKDNLWWKGKWIRKYDRRKEYTIKRWRTNFARKGKWIKKYVRRRSYIGKGT